jgi:hypothetical protein
MDLFDPHQPFTVPAGLEKRERELEALCSRLPRTPHEFPNEPKIYDLYRRYWGFYDPETMNRYRVANALQMEVVDRALGRFVNELKRRGLYDDALIIFTADHGEMNGRRGLVDKGVYLFPDVLRVPLYLKMPASRGVKPHAVESPVSHLDIAPTLLSLAGIQPEARMDGMSLLPIIQGAAGADRDLVFECGTHVGINFACGVQSWSAGGEHHLYAYNASSEMDELYDLRDSDAPNLSRTTEYAATRKRMIERMGSILASDPRWLAYWSSFRLDHYFDLPKGSGDMQLRTV